MLKRLYICGGVVIEVLVVLLLVGGPVFVTAQDEPELPDLGNFYPMVQEYADRSARSLSYLARDWPELEQWRMRARAQLYELLAFHPDPSELDSEVLESVRRKGFTRHLVRYSVTPGRKTEAYLLIPDGLKKPAPAILALHDHGGFYYFGKEKIVDTDAKPKVLREFIGASYGGRTYADELARRGFVVLCPDAFYFGSQRIDIEQVARHFTRKHPKLWAADLNESIPAFNEFGWQHETIVAKYLFAAGTTWPGVLFHGDRVSLDYLLSRPEVDPERIGCMGLSIGGFRSAHLLGLDPRIKVGVVAGWMTTYQQQLFNKLRWHTWMVYVPRLMEYLDVPDVVTLNAPRPLMVINCRKDSLYPLEAMEEADRKIASVYRKLGEEGKYLSRFYQVPHSLNVEMQDDAFEWLERWLMKKRGVSLDESH